MPRFIACSSRILVTSLTVESPHPVRRGTWCPGAGEACGRPPSLRLSANPHLSNSARVGTPSLQVLETTVSLQDSPPAASVSSLWDWEFISSIEAASPATGGEPAPDPIPSSSMTKGTTPASEQAIAARRAAGPEPMTTTSLDSIFQSRQRSQSQERDASSSTLQNHSATDIAILLTATAASNIFSVAPSGLNPEESVVWTTNEDTVSPFGPLRLTCMGFEPVDP